ncbi:hypothetical protein CKO50_14375 [Pseudoalteromonas sp. HM-SA03]|uniref:hypothetical protein n=1 Tax=Pseudoalteromonas sp. HM-SA03 TaxID=2029678 RepID=UPI000BAE1B3C|nr:hypothetical protein [Pseudoalteromonas sp. HM-SA03]PAY00683.1 hypothetical protein CKO50_14375 [Pseudoalteromonas sp. HM-SA03]
MKYLFLICAALGLSACSSTQPKSQTDTEIAQAEASPREQLYCDQEIITGTRFTKRRCRTAEQKAEAEREAKEMLRRQASSVGKQ